MTKPQTEEQDKQLLKITIPDAPPDEQIKMIEDLMFITKTVGEVTGEEVDLSSFEEAIRKIQSDTLIAKHSPSSPQGENGRKEK